MSNDNVFKLVPPGTFGDQRSEILRPGARTLLAQTAEAEVADLLAKHADLKTEDGRRRIIRDGDFPEREVPTGIGPVAVASRAYVIAKSLPTIPGAFGSRL